MSYPSPLTLSANVNLEMSSGSYILCVTYTGGCHDDPMVQNAWNNCTEVGYILCVTDSGGCHDDPMLYKAWKNCIEVGASQLDSLANVLRQEACNAKRSETGGMQRKRGK